MKRRALHLCVWGGNRHEDMYAEDYVCIRAFELAVGKIYAGEVPGAVAELGVFRGDFAKYINEAFPDRAY